MASVRGLKPKITWGAAFANTITFAYALDGAVVGALLRDGSEVVQLVSGVEDASVAGFDQTLTGDVRWLLGETAGGITGWDGTTGWAAFLEWAWAKQSFRYYPDATAGTYYSCYWAGEAALPTLEPNGRRRVTLTIRTADGSRFVGY